MRILLVGLIILLVIGCSSETNNGFNSDGGFKSNSSGRAGSFWEVTETWGQSFGMGGAIVYFEVVTTPSAQIGGMCEVQMWAGKKAYDLKEIVVQPNDLQKGITQTVSFEISGQDKILALVQEGKDLDDVVKLEMQCANPTPTPKPTP